MGRCETNRGVLIVDKKRFSKIKLSKNFYNLNDRNRYQTMAKLHINHIQSFLKENYSPQLWDDRLQDHNNYSRLLGYWTTSRFLEKISGPEVGSTYIVDGEQDKGIDAVGIDVENNIIVFTQSKWRQDGKKSIQLSEMTVFLRGVERHLGNSNVSTRRSTIENSSFYETFQSVIDNANVKIYIIITTTGEPALSPDVMDEVNDLLQKFNFEGEAPMMFFEHFDQKKLHRMLKKNDTSVNFSLQLLDWNRHRDQESRSVFYGRVNAADIAKIFSENGNLLFAENIRVGIQKSEVNMGIRETVITEPSNFFLYNNGITIVAEKIGVPALGVTNKDAIKIELENASIINGAQTATTLGRILDDPERLGNLQEAYVLVRCIEVPSSENLLTKRITQFANTQNVVSNQDFAFLDKNQHRLAEELEHFEYKYNIRSSKESNPADNVIELREAAVALACANKNIKYTVLAKGAVGKLFDYYDPDGNYHSLFNDGTNSLVLLRAWTVVDRVSKLFEEIKRNSYYEARGVAVNGKLFVSHLIIQSIGYSDMQNPDLGTDFLLQGLEHEAVKLHEEITKLFKDDEYFKEYFPGNVFKNQSHIKMLIGKLN